MRYCRTVPIKFEAHANAFTVVVFNYQIGFLYSIIKLSHSSSPLGGSGGFYR